RAQRVETFLEQFLFPGASKHARIGTLSGGERNRVLLARLLCRGGNVIVLDEPTNDLDLASLRALEDALLQFPGSLLVVSHDRWSAATRAPRGRGGPRRAGGRRGARAGHAGGGGSRGGRGGGRGGRAQQTRAGARRAAEAAQAQHARAAGARGAAGADRTGRG